MVRAHIEAHRASLSQRLPPTAPPSHRASLPQRLPLTEPPSKKHYIILHQIVLLLRCEAIFVGKRDVKPRAMCRSLGTRATCYAAWQFRGDHVW